MDTDENILGLKQLGSPPSQDTMDGRGRPKSLPRIVKAVQCSPR
jgi:hypothetical protein